MIFVTVGTQLPFDRLLRGVDAWAGAHPGTEVHAQTGRVGSGGYRPAHMRCTPGLDPAAFARRFARARLVVAHAGTGSILQAHERGVPILVMPRRAALGEHRNDHQLATAAHFGGRAGVNVVHEEAELAPAIDRLLAAAPEPPALEAFADPALIAALRGAIFGPGSAA